MRSRRHTNSNAFPYIRFFVASKGGQGIQRAILSPRATTLIVKDNCLVLGVGRRSCMAFVIPVMAHDVTMDPFGPPFGPGGTAPPAMIAAATSSGTVGVFVLCTLWWWWWYKQKRNKKNFDMSKAHKAPSEDGEDLSPTPPDGALVATPPTQDASLSSSSTSFGTTRRLRSSHKIMGSKKSL